MKSFYEREMNSTAATGMNYAQDPEQITTRWSAWLEKWQALINDDSALDAKTEQPRTREQISRQMKLANPKYSLREWLLAPAYQQAAEGDYAIIRELQDVMTQPYAEQSKEVEAKYYKQKPLELFEIGGLSHYSCSS